MFIKNSVLSILVYLFISTSAQAAEQTVTLDVPGMTCITCPITVKRALRKMEGVVSVETDYEKREAVVIYDDEQVKPADLELATTEAGYPAKVKPSVEEAQNNG